MVLISRKRKKVKPTCSLLAAARLGTLTEDYRRRILVRSGTIEDVRDGYQSQMLVPAQHMRTQSMRCCEVDSHVSARESRIRDMRSRT